MDAQHIRRGSSPLARGLPYTIWTGEHEPGIIPARAGFTPLNKGRRHPPRDHPRSRGVYMSVIIMSDRPWGSSPLARGLRGEVGGAHIEGGIIPARAGFTRRTPAAYSSHRDHPRSRGVYGVALDVDPAAVWIIPARAGFTPTGPRDRRPHRDHPRSRGVYSLSRCSASAAVGSSPLARGLRQGSAADRRQAVDHPRSRGVYPGFYENDEILAGSSPLARGLPLGLVRHDFSFRIIPARAGFTFRP